MNSGKDKTIYLHVGTHKTGSSAIQWTLRGSRQHLLDHGYDCIRHPHKILDPILDIAPVSNETFESVKLQFDEVVSQAEADKIIVSYELIFGQPEAGYANNLSNLERIKQIIGNRPCKVLFFLRRQDLFVESHYVQMVKTSYTGKFGDYLEILASDCFDWNQMAANYEKQFGRENLTILPYKGDVVDQFYEYLGIPVPDWEAEKKWQMNPSVSLYGMELKRRCNKYLKIRAVKVRLKYLMVEYFPKQANEPFGFFDGNERLKFLESYQAGNEALENRYDTKFFPNISEIDSNSISSLNDLPEIHDETAALICRLVSELADKDQKT